MKTPSMLRVASARTGCDVSKIRYLTVRPEPGRRAPNEFSHSLTSVESFSAACLEGDHRSYARSFMHKIEGLVNSLQGKPVRDHRINLDLAA